MGVNFLAAKCSMSRKGLVFSSMYPLHKISFAVPFGKASLVEFCEKKQAEDANHAHLGELAVGIFAMTVIYD